MSSRRERNAGGGSERTSEPRESAEEALRRAASHTRSAAGELLLAAGALVDAAALASTGRPAREHRALARLASLLEELAAQLGDSDGASARKLVGALAEALDAEIARWESRASEDSEARAVLRAFLGLRELLWEFGIRRDDGSPAAHSEGESAKRRPGPRVQRVSVDG